MTEHDENGVERVEHALETIDESKRDSLRTILTGAVFVAPVIASFALNGLTVAPAFATTNSTHS